MAEPPLVLFTSLCALLCNGLPFLAIGRRRLLHIVSREVHHVRVKQSNHQHHQQPLFSFPFSQSPFNDDVSPWTCVCVYEQSDPDDPRLFSIYHHHQHNPFLPPFPLLLSSSLNSSTVLLSFFCKLFCTFFAKKEEKEKWWTKKNIPSLPAGCKIPLIQYIPTHTGNMKQFGGKKARQIITKWTNAVSCNQISLFKRNK